MKNWPKEVLEKFRQCMYCDKRLILGCGQPHITIGGCCSFVEHEGTRYVSARKAHVQCWLEQNNLKIVDDPQRKLNNG